LTASDPGPIICGASVLIFCDRGGTLKRGRLLVPGLTLAGLGVLFLAAAAPPQEAPPAVSETAVVAPPLPPGPAPDLNLVFTSQVVGWVEPCG
jgi:hypothetical protein